MPEIEIRPVGPEDLSKIQALDPDYTSDHVWQMDLKVEGEHIGVSFRQARLPRSVRVEYPRPRSAISAAWLECASLLIAQMEEQIVGYIRVEQNPAPLTAWVTDLVVERRLRRQGIGTALLLAAQEWCTQQGRYRLIVEMQPKNHPAICLAEKLGYAFSGFNDHYYVNQDVALYFAKQLR